MLSDLVLAHMLADTADIIAMKWFSPGGLAADMKADGSPVTAADREVEATIQRLLAEHRPDDGVLGEEVGASGPTERRWILDGIDGTHNFAAGATEWGTHIALEDGGEMALGVVTSPALGGRWWAERGGGAWTAAVVDGRRGHPTRLNCTETAMLGSAVVATLPPAARTDGWKATAAAALERGGVFPTAFGHSAIRVATGQADVALHLAGGPWDHAVGVVIVEEAGGRFADAWGGRRIDTGTAVFSNAALIDDVMTTLAAWRPAHPDTYGTTGATN